MIASAIMRPAARGRDMLKEVVCGLPSGSGPRDAAVGALALAPLLAPSLLPIGLNI
eukprot:COSAG01_NODE_3834_length_5650_cov_4.421005_1_plen_56_part_00